MQAKVNVQSIFLNQIRTHKDRIRLVTTTKEVYVGYVIGFDDFTVVIEVENRQHMFYKTAIHSIELLEEVKIIKKER